MQVKATHHIAIYTGNFEEMQNFYGETLGFAVTRRWDDVGIVFYDIGSTVIELVNRDNGPTIGNPPGINHLALHVDSVDETYQELVDKGVTISVEPRDFQTIRIAFFLDPDGNVIAAMSLNRPAAENAVTTEGGNIVVPH